MDAKREQVLVGLFVVVAAVLLIVTIFGITGAFGGSTKSFHAKFPNVAGLEPGATVRYEGGPKIGRVEKVVIDPDDPSQMDLVFSVNKDLPIKTDSKATILSLSPLGDNHLEIMAGSRTAPLAPSGALLPSIPYVGFNELTAQINRLAPQAQELLANLNDRVTQLKVTVDRVNDLLNDKNRTNISASIAELRGMLAEDRPLVKSTLNNVNEVSEKMRPLLEQLRQTTVQADETLKHVDGMVAENREDVRASVAKLRESLNRVSEITRRLDQTLDVNAENIDQILLNMREVSENLKEFTDIIKTRPAALVNTRLPREHRPGEQP